MLWLLLACTPEESIEAAPERTLPADWGPYTVGVDTQWYTCLLYTSPSPRDS